MISSASLLYHKFFVENQIPTSNQSSSFEQDSPIICQSPQCINHEYYKNKNLIKCSHSNCTNYSHLLCSRLNGFLISTLSSPTSSTSINDEKRDYSVQFECKLHYTVPQFCICKASLIDHNNTENIIRCNRCYEWYHPKCLNIHTEDDFCCNFCNELPDLANLKSINIAKKDRATAIQRGNIIILALHEFEVNVCPTIDKITLLEPHLSSYPTIQDALSNDATLALRIYSSPQYQAALKSALELNDVNFYGLASLLSQWESMLLNFKNHSIPDTILMEWCCSVNLILQDISLNTNQFSFQNPLFSLLLQNLLIYLEGFMNQSLQPAESIQRINSIVIEDKFALPLPSFSSYSDSYSTPPPPSSSAADIFSQTSNWIYLIFQLFSSTEFDQSDDDSLPLVTPGTMEIIIKRGRNLLQVYEDIATWDLNDSFSWLHEIHHLLSKFLDILESKWVEINNFYGKINRLYPILLLTNKGKDQNKIDERVLHELIKECEEMLIRSEILEILRRIELQFTLLDMEITDNLTELSIQHLPILEELELKIQLFPVIVESHAKVRSCIQILKGFSEFPDFFNQNFICQNKITFENYETFLHENSLNIHHYQHQHREQHQIKSKKRSRELTSSPPPPQNKIHYEMISNFLELEYYSEYFCQSCQIYYENILFLSNHLKQLISEEKFQIILHSTDETLETILTLLQSEHEKIQFYYERLQQEYYECVEEYELKYLLGSIEIINHFMLRQQNINESLQPNEMTMMTILPTIESFQNHLTVIELNQEVNFIHELINYSESSSSYLLIQTLGKLFKNEILENITKCLSAYEVLTDYLEQILYTDEFSISLNELKYLYYCVYFVYNIRDLEPTAEEQKKKHHRGGGGSSGGGGGGGSGSHHTPRTLFYSLKKIIEMTEHLEIYLKSLPALDIKLIHEHVQQTKEEFLEVFPSVEFDDFENIMTIIYRLPLSQEFKESITRNFKLDSIESLTAKHFETIMTFTSKIVDGTGKWLLKTPLKDVDRKEISSLYEGIKLEVNVVHQAIQDVTKTNIEDMSSSISSKLEDAISSHIQLKWLLLCCKCLLGIIEPISLDSANLLLEEWNTSLLIDTTSVTQEYNFTIPSSKLIPSSEVLQIKDFVNKWIQMTVERQEGLEEITKQYQTSLQECDQKYSNALAAITNETSQTNLTSIDEIAQHRKQTRLLFELILELKLSLHSLQDKVKTDKRLLYNPVFRLPDDLTSQISTFLAVFQILSFIPNSIVLLFAEESEYQNSYAGILSYDRLQKIIKLFNNNSNNSNNTNSNNSNSNSNSNAGNGTNQLKFETSCRILLDMKKFLELLFTKATEWTQESKKLIPVATRAGIKKAAVQYTIHDIQKVLSDPITRYLEPPGYQELTDVVTCVHECEKELLLILIPSHDDDYEEEQKMVTFLDTCRLIEKWNNLRDRIQQLPIQLERCTPLIKWFTELFEWIRAVPEQVFDELQYPELHSNQFNITNNSKKLNFIEKERSKTLLELGNVFLSQSNHDKLIEIFQEQDALDENNDNVSNDRNENHHTTFFHFNQNVNSIIRFTIKIYEYFLKSFEETTKFEILAKGIMTKISNTTTAENLDKNIELIKKLIMRCDELFILPDGFLRMNMKNLLRQLETSLWDGITLFNENKKVELEVSSEDYRESEQWIPTTLNNSQSTSEELLSTAMSYFEDENDEFNDGTFIEDIDDDDEFTPTSSSASTSKTTSKRRRRSKPSRRYDSYEYPSQYKSLGRRSQSTTVDIADDENENADEIDDDEEYKYHGKNETTRRHEQVAVVEEDEEQEEEVPQNCILEDCEWPRMNNSIYCSENCAVKGCKSLFESLYTYKPVMSHQLVSRSIEMDKSPKLELVVNALEKGNVTSESLVNDCKMFGMRTSDIMFNSLTQTSIDFLIPPLPAIGTMLSNSLRKQVRIELQNAILSSLTRLNIPCAFGCAVVISTDIENSMANNVTTEDSVRIYRKKYMLLSKALKDPYNDKKIHKILLNEMSVEELLKLDSTEFDDDEKQQRRLESINAEKKKIVPAGKSLTELLEEKRRAAEGGVEAWRDGTAMDQANAAGKITSANPSNIPPLSSTTTTSLPTSSSVSAPTSPQEQQQSHSTSHNKLQKDMKIDTKETKQKENESKSLTATSTSSSSSTVSTSTSAATVAAPTGQESPRANSSPRPPKQIAPTITSLLQMESNKRPIKNEQKNEFSQVGGISRGEMPSSSSLSSSSNISSSTIGGNAFDYFTEVKVSTPLGPASAHIPQIPNPEDGPLKVLLTNQNDSEFLIHITNYPMMRETVSLVCTGGIFDCTGQGIIMSGIQNDKRYQVDALRKQLRNFKKHIPISILVLSVKEERELTEGKYRFICNMFSDPEKERIPSVEFHGDHEQIYNLHIIVPQLVHYFPQLNPIVQKSTALLPHGFWMYGILEMDRDAHGPESLVRCNQIDFPVENIRFLLGKVDKLVNTIEAMPEPDVKLAIERVQQTLGNQFDFLNPGHKDFQFFINQVNQRLREKKLKEWSRDNEKKRKHELQDRPEKSKPESRIESVGAGSEKSKSFERNKNNSSRIPSTSSTSSTSSYSSHENRNHTTSRDSTRDSSRESPRNRDSWKNEPSSHHPPNMSRRSSYDDQPPLREPQLLRSRSDEFQNGGSHYSPNSHSHAHHHASHKDRKGPDSGESQRKSRFT